MDSEVLKLIIGCISILIFIAFVFLEKLTGFPFISDDKIRWVIFICMTGLALIPFFLLYKKHKIDSRRDRKQK